MKNVMYLRNNSTIRQIEKNATCFLDNNGNSASQAIELISGFSQLFTDSFGFSWILSDSLGNFNEFLTIYVRVFGEAEISWKTTHYKASVK